MGIKYSYADMARTAEYVGISGDFSVVIGADNLFHSGLVMGCDGTVSGTASVYPEVYAAIYEAYRNKDKEESIRKLQKLGFRLAAILRNGSMACFKAALANRGFDAGGMRAPLLDLPEIERKELIKKLKKWEEDFFKK